MTRIALVIAGLLAVQPLQAMAGFDLPGSDKLSSLVNGESESKQSSPLTDLLSSELNISPEQALSGGGALLSLAESQLGSEQKSELTELVPGLSNLTGVNNLLGGIENMEMVKTAFSSVGLDPAMINQFTPLILQYLGGNGASENLLGSLSNIWNAE